MEKLDFETILVESAKLPMVRIDRGEFLRRELHNKYSPEVIDDAINNNPAHAGIPFQLPAAGHCLQDFRPCFRQFPDDVLPLPSAMVHVLPGQAPSSHPPPSFLFPSSAPYPLTDGKAEQPGP